MLSCRDLAHRHASDYLDGQLGWRARLGVQFHLIRCDYCRRFVAQLRKVRTLLRDKPQNYASADPAILVAQQELGEHLAKIYIDQKKSLPPL